jgi:hypothetical protein
LLAGQRKVHHLLASMAENPELGFLDVGGRGQHLSAEGRHADLGASYPGD